VAYAKILNARRTKLNDKSEKCIFIGYNDRRMEYKFFNLITKKVIMSRDVIFEEDKKVANEIRIKKKSNGSILI
jgi:hypothetical protein